MSGKLSLEKMKRIFELSGLEMLFKGHWLLLLLLLATLSGCGLSDEPNGELDILIVNGSVYDGTNTPGKPLNLGIKGDEIKYLGSANSTPPTAKRIIDASGLVVAPGFIDPHTHVLEELTSEDASRRLNRRYLSQGVTAIFDGNDGYGTPDITTLSAALGTAGIGTNIAFFVGHGRVRQSVMGNENRAPTEYELTRMKAQVRDAMEAGALGISTGLYYVPGNYATTEEVIALARVAAEYGGIYESHIRDESSYGDGLLVAIEEAIYIGEAAGIPVHIAHIKALGADVWGKAPEVIERIESARARGVQVTADQYPWLASVTSLRAALLPQALREGSEDAIQARLDESAMLDVTRDAVLDNIRRRGGAERLVFTGHDNVANDERWSDLKGLSLADVANQQAKSAVHLVLSLVKQGDPVVISYNMTASDVETFMRQPWVMTSSDGGDGHPRVAASFPRKYATYVKDKRLMSVAEFVHRSTGLTARTFNLADRGFIKEGYTADIVIFDPERYAPKADYAHPHVLSAGVEYLLVNGALVIERGNVKQVLAGRVLKKAPAAEPETDDGVGAISNAISASEYPRRINIATFDSGFGGFFTAKSIEKTSFELLKQYDASIRIKHYGDTRNAPYGEKTPEQIAELASRGVLNALDNGADMVFVACNTASTQYDKIRKAVERAYPGRGDDVVSIVETSITSAKAIIDKRLQTHDEAYFAILATPATVKSMVYPRRLAALYGVEAEEQAVNSFRQPRWLQSKGQTIESATQQTTLNLPSNKTIHIYQMAPGNWVDLIEQGGDLIDKNRAVTRDMQYLFDLLPAQAQLDVVGYFCTHYPALDNAIQQEVAKNNYNRSGTAYIKQAPLMADIFRGSAENVLAGYRRANSIAPEHLAKLTAQSRASITLTGDNIEVTKNLTRTFFPDDPEPVIVKASSSDSSELSIEHEVSKKSRTRLNIAK